MQSFVNTDLMLKRKSGVHTCIETIVLLISAQNHEKKDGRYFVTESLQGTFLIKGIEDVIGFDID